MNILFKDASDTHSTLQSITSILLSRFILDLRSVDLQQSDDSEGDLNVSSIHFAGFIEGNMGASLHASWFTGMDQQQDDRVDARNEW